MQKNQLLSITSFIVTSLSSISLIASTTNALPISHTYSSDSNSLWNDDDDLLADLPEGLQHDSTLLGHDEPLTDDKTTKEDLDLPFEEADSNIEEQDQTAAQPTMQPDVQKVLYDPTMNYGKGAPIPKPAPVSTVTRNVIALATSAILGTVAMLVVASNKGRDAPHGH